MDHPSFGMAIITRVLESRGYTVGVIAQPDWRDEKKHWDPGASQTGFSGLFRKYGFHGQSLYSFEKNAGQWTLILPGERWGFVRTRAVIVYSNLIRKVYHSVPVILGGIEASLRRMGHYDYWEDRVRRSILLDSGADLISYGMGEHSVVAVADALQAGLPVESLTFIPGTVYRCKETDHLFEPEFLPSFEEICQDRKAYARSFLTQYENTDFMQGKTLVEDYGNQGYVVQNPPSEPLTTQEMDDVYALPYMRSWHPSYDREGGIPAFQEIKFSLTSNRGCFGGCSFCALTFHQGRIVQVRSHDSLLAEAEELTKEPDFKGYIHDVGGSTADFRHPSCKKQLKKGVCPKRQCLFPEPCPNLEADHRDYVEASEKTAQPSESKKSIYPFRNPL